MATTKMIQSHMVIPFINRGTDSNPNWVQIKKTVDWNMSFNAETEDRKYISDRYATTEVLRYKPSVPISLTTINGEDDFTVFDGMRKKLPTGDDAKTQLLLVRLEDVDEYTEGTDYPATLANVTVVIDSEDTVNSTLSVTLNFNGTPTEGTASFEDGVPSFTEAAGSNVTEP